MNKSADPPDAACLTRRGHFASAGDTSIADRCALAKRFVIARGRCRVVLNGEAGAFRCRQCSIRANDGRDRDRLRS